MASHLDHEKRKRTKRSVGDVIDAANTQIATSKLLQSNDNAMQRSWLEELLTRPELTDFQRRDLQESLEWLRAIPMRRLSHSYQRRYRNVEFVCELKRKGTYTPPSEEKKAEAQRRAALRKIRHEESRPKTPDWMQDKTLLPKKPPTRL